MIRSDRCRRCRAPLTDVEMTLLGKHWLRDEDSRPGTFSGKKCEECGWNNLVALEQFYDIDLADLALEVHLRSIDLSDTDDREEILNRVRLARAAVGSRIRNLVLDHPSWAIAWLVAMIAGVGVERSTDDANRVLAVQQVYACLVGAGPIDLSTFAAGTLAPDTWVEEVARLAQTMSRLSGTILELGSTTASGASIASGVLRLVPSGDLIWMTEVNLSRIEDPDRGYHRDLVQAVDDVEVKVYGASARGLLLQLIGSGSAVGIARATAVPGVLVVDLESPDQTAALLNRFMVLTFERWRSRTVPSFFFADQRRVHRTEQALLVQASSANWLGFAPLLHAQMDSVAVGLTSLGLLAQAYGQAVAAISSRLHLASNVAAVDRGLDVAAVRAKARDVHSEFERAAAAECTAGGVPSMSGVELMDGKRLPCGEIDILGGCVGPRGPVLLVGECKNFDFTFFKDLGPHQARSLIRKGTDQVIRKRSWVGLNWPRITRSLQLPSIEPEVLAVIVTRTIAAPAEQDGIPVLAIAELASLATLVATMPSDTWPRHVRRGAVAVADL
jgi:hypothetical protein